MNESGTAVGGLAMAPTATLSADGDSVTTAVPQYDPNLVKAYILNLLPVLLGSPDAQQEEEEAINMIFAFPDANEKCRRFANDPQSPVLYVTKELAETEVTDGDAMDQASSSIMYLLSHDVSYRPNHIASLALIKRGPVLDAGRPIALQVQVMNLPGPAAHRLLNSATPDVTAVATNPYEALHAYIHHAVSPFFNAYTLAKQQLAEAQGPVSAGKRDDKDAKMGIPMAKKKFAELELSLLHLQQNVEIPDIALTIHPAIQRAVESCRADQRRVTVDAVDAVLLTDSQFLNRLQNDVNGWIKEIQKVTKLTRDPASGTASQEINFWLSMERALEKIDEQLKSDEIVLTLEVLKNAKRFHATVSFIADTGLSEGMETVFKYNQLMKDFPLDELLAATDVGKVKDALHLIFGHVNKKLKLSPYPIRRALPLVEAISRDLNDQLLKVLGSRRLMSMDYGEFDRVTAGAEQVFATWDDQIKEFTNVAREVTRKRLEKFIPIKINPAHAALQERINFIRQFRLQHEQLHATIVKVMQSSATERSLPAANGDPAVAMDVDSGESLGVVSDVDSIDEVKRAYESVKNIDVLDVSSEGTEMWMAAETTYNERVARVENQIISRLRDRLATARNANEMFRVFSKFNALFVRPKIRGAIQEYQAQLIDNVKDDIRKLHDKFKEQYRHSEAYHMSQLRDIPPISGAIIWARQIERQLAMYMRRVEDVLGKGWELYAEGQRLQADSQSFRKKLDTRQIYDAWFADISKRDLAVAGRIFTIARNRAQGNTLQLSINFDAQVITLFKEVRNLQWLGFQVPHTITNIAKDAKRVYPFAVSLIETARTYRQTIHQINRHPEIASLAAGYITDVHQLIARGIHFRWDYFVNSFDPQAHGSAGMGFASYTSTRLGTLDVGENEHVGFVREFAQVVGLFQEKMDTLIAIYGDILCTIQDIASCPYTREALAGGIVQIQKLIDQLNLENFANLPSWVQQLDQKLETVLIDRLREAVRAWTAAFQGRLGADGLATSTDDTVAFDTKARRKRKLGVGRMGEPEPEAAPKSDQTTVRPRLDTLVHELCIRNQVMFLNPPLEQARADWYQQLHDWLAVICRLPRIQSSRYEIGLTVRSDDQANLTYQGLLTQLGDESLVLAYQGIEEKMAEVQAYVQEWLQYQSLWDLAPEFIYGQLGDDLVRWQQILTEIKAARATFDNSDSERTFGPIVIDYDQVQSKVNAKYDAWQREILNKFGYRLGQAMRDFHAAVSKARLDLEQHTVDTASTTDAVTFITFVQELKRKTAQWTTDVNVFRQGQKVLERQRYQFPNDWLYMDQVDGEWSAFSDILARKNNAIQEQIAGLQLKIVAEDRAVEQRIKEVVGDWEKNKPVQGDIKPDLATNTLSIYEGRITRLKDEYDQVCRAKEALDLELTANDRLEPVLEELRDLKAVWASLATVWQSIFELKDAPWSTTVPRKVRQRLDALLASTKQMPTRMRQYAAFEYMQETLRQYLKANPLLMDLKSDALRERHWRQLFKTLRVEGRIMLNEMTLGQLWDLDLRRNESLVREVITVAQGEMALEEFLRQVRETWTNYVLDLVNYQNKCRLIKGWDELFTKCGENLSALTAMRMSPYYKVFEEEAAGWEDKLNRIHVLFDVWIDVQRQWVYLEGIFTGSADIKHLLPVETSRFQNINAEFLTVMKKVYKSPFVLDVLNIANIQKSLERLADLLHKIQKALGEYLERERSSFPRFYFVGDEDLLEIIGNSKEVGRIQKHFKKMFAGLCFIQLTDDESQIVGMTSREGERVAFHTPISLVEHPKINDWLTLLEREMKHTLALLLTEAVGSLQITFAGDQLVQADFLQWLNQFPAQLVVLAAQVVWSQTVDHALTAMAETGTDDQAPLHHALAMVERGLNVLADTVLTDLETIARKKCEHLITELVHQRDVIRALLRQRVASPRDFAWLHQMRFYLNTGQDNPLERLVIRMANASFYYGFEYLGIADRLVQTPLTDRCYLTLTQALDGRLGGSPFGPAGTGKTESVKALGAQLGRFVLVFCCDENFDFQAMGRIFVGLCQVGAWGCFDEFNRLEERILSAVSQQIQTIQLGLRTTRADTRTEIELVGKTVPVSPDTGVFITMNPGYAGRSNLPDNLKKLFRSIAMTKPDRELIAQVMLYSQGFRTAELLASKVVPLFNLCSEQLSPQPHYDFGLRALKSVLVSAGNLKRDKLQALRALVTPTAETISEGLPEQEILIQSVRETVVPKLVADDIPLLTSLLADVFPGVDYKPVDLAQLRAALAAVCQEKNLVPGPRWEEKVIQLYQIQNIHHGLMMVGPSGSGKSKAWQVLLTALERVEQVEGISYVIDPKAISKDDLYGTLDPTTREWTDGLFTHILRKIVDNVRGESAKRHWIIFDGDVDPEWVENLNSVLDDNRLLTLPNGERLGLPPNVRIMFEVETLKYATLATVSRCGMVWFSDDVVSLGMLHHHYLATLRSEPLEDADEGISSTRRAAAAAQAPVGTDERGVSPILLVQQTCATCLEPLFASDQLVSKALAYARGLNHIMDFTTIRVLATLFSLLNKSVRQILEYNAQHVDFPLAPEQVEQYMTKRLIYGLIWSFAGDAPLDMRIQLSEFIQGVTTIDLPLLGSGLSIIDYDVSLTTGEWVPWQTKVPVVEIETHKVAEADVIIPTVDTVRHEEVLYSWLAEHKPLILCGPPGSGKTMTLFSALRKLPDLEVVGLNFSSATTPELILKTFEQYCEYRKTPNGVVLSPLMIGRWLVVFCDEINLPANDKYGTQRVISFLRQLIESGGYWRAADKQWVRLERIQFVGACNPPTDPGRVPLSHRFLRHAPLVMVDYPGEISLRQIYGTFARAMLKVVPTLRAYADPLTAAMVELYLASQRRFTPDIQAHYIYSPRELTRWMRGIYEAIKPLDALSVEGLVRVWAHEALRLFQDRLVDSAERQWTDEQINAIATTHFPTMDTSEALARPILFSNWLSKFYIPVDRETLRDYVKARLKVFYEEELDVPLVLFNDVLDHVLRIDRVFRQMQGHLLLIGVSGSGKTTLSRFVAWMNGLSVFQIKVHNQYSGDDFDEDLRVVLRRAGCKGEKICFIMDESNVLDSGFLERMNTLLANAEVPGLFEGDEYATLMTQCKEGAQREGLMLDSGEELYKWFTQQVMKNLHVVFTMNPPEGGLASRAATSPALFNRCVLDWFGDWSDQAFFQVGKEFTHTLDLDLPSYAPPNDFPLCYRDLPLPITHRDAIVNALVYVHMSLYEVNAKLSKRQGRHNYVTPRHYLDFIQHYVRLFNEKREDLEEQQRHLNMGLDKLHETVTKVEELRQSLAVKKAELTAKVTEADEKLKTMLQKQQDAEKSKAASLEFQRILQVKNVAIEERRAIVMRDLENAEPAVLEAQRSVSGIKKQQLTEVRSMTNPPEAVKMAMESVCTLLGHRIDTWKTVQGIIRRDDFIASIVNFDTDRQMNRALREQMRDDYLGKPHYNYEQVNRASKACGPLVKWVIAQVNYSEILERVGPLRQEVQTLEMDAEDTRLKATEVEQVVAELEQSIARYKDEYALLISETQMIKSEMERVKSKVDRSVTLLASLSSEKERWEGTSATFEMQMGTIVGDVLLSSAFLAYGGYFDQQYRELLFGKWTGHLFRASIQFKQDISIPEYLSTADDRLAWQANELPADDLCTENAIMLHRFNRYPLIIDPSGQATAFLVNQYKDRKITITSFLDTAFLKNLESALRFGNPLLIQDVENLDPILNPILNKELRRTGGRVLIRLGGQDIDFSPSFTLFLTTRDPSVNFPPDICSRVTFVNFTVTRGSLQSQCLNRVLKVERPDTDRKRTDLVKLQGEFRLRLRHLEKSLLQALSTSKGNILDDDNVITTLETLKTEAADVSRKVEETDVVMQEIEHVLALYTPLAQACSAIFFTLEQLNLVHHFYQFSLDFFYDIFHFVLSQKNPRLKGVTDSDQRLQILHTDLFNVTFQRASGSLLHDDHLTLLMLLGVIKWRSLADSAQPLGPHQAVLPALNEIEYNFLLDGADMSALLQRSAGPAATFDPAMLPAEVRACMSDTAITQLKQLLTLPTCGALLDHMQQAPHQWVDLLQTTRESPEVVPRFWTVQSSDPWTAVDYLRSLLVTKCLRPDLILTTATRFVEELFDPQLVNGTGVDLARIVQTEVTASTPVALCSVPGHDASYLVDSLSADLNTRCHSVAMGSIEGYTLADQAIAQAVKSGTWVLLKNVHLAASWLHQLEKKLYGLRPHPSFRLFLTMETNPKVPVNLLRLSRVLMFEPPPGIKANLQQSLQGIPAKRLAKGPTERTRLYFLLAWLHAVVIERLRYAPLGWTKVYEFNDADQNCGLATIDIWLDSVSQGRANVAPDKIPWDAIKSLLIESVYGGRIDNEFDQQLLESFVESLFQPRSFDLQFALVGGPTDPNAMDVDGGVAAAGSLLIPEGTKAEHFLQWVEQLPEHEPPTWLGLPSNAEKLLLEAKGQKLLSKVRKMKNLTDDEDAAYTQEASGPDATLTSSGAAQQPAWMRAIATTTATWLGVLPTLLVAMTKDADRMASPLYRVFYRENQIGRSLLAVVRQDLADLQQVCEGTLKQTNHLRMLLDCFNKGSPPEHWHRYKVPADFSLTQWLGDFQQRLAQLDTIANAAKTDAAGLDELPIWFGGLFYPEAYITATRQAVAQRHNWSLEQLDLELDLGSSDDVDAFKITDLRIEGGTWHANALQLSPVATRLPLSQIRWVHRATVTADAADKPPRTRLPVYLNADRCELLFAAPIQVCAQDQQLIAQRGVAVIAGL
ncbi:dynein heavy chain [Dimargaris xerosporica]|nr:dynein heavy chain [Dimargaris xerosporica]